MKILKGLKLNSLEVEQNGKKKSCCNWFGG